jgi:hypothetical protein
MNPRATCEMAKLAVKSRTKFTTTEVVTASPTPAGPSLTVMP